MRSFRSARRPFPHWRPTAGYQNLVQIHFRRMQAASHLRWNPVLHSWRSVIIRGLKISTGFIDASCETIWTGRGSQKWCLPSVCDLLRKMVLARGWSEGLYSMGRSESRSKRSNPLRQDLKTERVATRATQQTAANGTFCPLASQDCDAGEAWMHYNKVKWCYGSLKGLIKGQTQSSSTLIQIWPLSRTHGSLVNTLRMTTPLKQEVLLMWSVSKSFYFC